MKKELQIIEKLSFLVLKKMQSYRYNYFLNKELIDCVDLEVERFFNWEKVSDLCYYYPKYDHVSRSLEYKILSILSNMISRAFTLLKEKEFITFKRGLLVRTKEGVRIATTLEEAQIKLYEAKILEELGIEKKDKRKTMSTIRYKTLISMKDTEYSYITSYFMGYGDLKISQEKIDCDKEEIIEALKPLVLKKLKEVEFSKRKLDNIEKYYEEKMGKKFSINNVKKDWNKIIDFCVLEKEVEF